MTPITFTTPKPTYRLALGCIGRGLKELAFCLTRSCVRATLATWRFLRPRWKEVLIALLTLSTVTLCTTTVHYSHEVEHTKDDVRHAIDSVSALIPVDSLFLTPGSPNYDGGATRTRPDTDIPE